jgi:hypothetical protein
VQGRRSTSICAMAPPGASAGGLRPLGLEVTDGGDRRRARWRLGAGADGDLRDRPQRARWESSARPSASMCAPSAPTERVTSTFDSDDPSDEHPASE